MKTSFAERLKILRESWAKAGSSAPDSRCTTSCLEVPTTLQANNVATSPILIGFDGDLGRLRLASLR